MSVNDLPNEILRQIIGLVPKSDLKALSLVSKTFETVTTPFLFSSVNVWLGLYDLQR